MKIGVKILPRPEVLDTQGRAVAKTLADHGKAVNQCRVGKYVEIEVDQSDEQAALAKAKELTEFVLYNPLIETYSLEVVGK